MEEMRTGQQYLASLDDGRAVFVDGAKVESVSCHPAFAGITRTVASLYDLAADPVNEMIFTSPETGESANKAFMIPRSPADLAGRRQAIMKWAEVSKGFVGRSPDHVSSFFAGFASAPETFDKGERRFGKNVVELYRKMVGGSLFLSYVIIPPQIDRSTTAHAWSEELLQLGVLKEQDGGFVVRGAQMLGTSAAISDWLFSSCIRPLAPQDERYAISFVAPVNTAGVKMYCRRPYAPNQPSGFDYPLSTRFDESDALVVFDDVFVPWENVLVYRDVEQVRRQFFETPAHVLGNSQAQIRLIAKMRFIVGVARKIAQVNGTDQIAAVQEKLGELGSLAAFVEGMVLASEASCVLDRNGVARPNPRFLYGAMGLQAEVYPRAISLLRELAGAGVIQLPSSARDLTSEATRRDMERYHRSTHTAMEDRVKLFKLAWDMVGSEFAGRHLQYEMFYAGAPFISRGYAFRNYGYEDALESAESFLRSYGLSSVPAP
jgi:4-hydroxyphenylacetate 3-monooxygenase